MRLRWNRQVWTWAILAYVLASCAVDSDWDMDDKDKANKVARSDKEREAIGKLYRLIDEAEALRDQPGVPEADRVALGKAADAARDALGRYIAKHEQGKNRDRMMSYITTAAAGIVLNDLAGGIMDDPLLIVCGVGALGTIIFMQGTRPRPRSTHRGSRLASSSRCWRAR